MCSSRSPVKRGRAAFAPAAAAGAGGRPALAGALQRVDRGRPRNCEAPSWSRSIAEVVLAALPEQPVLAEQPIQVRATDARLLRHRRRLAVVPLHPLPAIPALDVVDRTLPRLGEGG